MVTVVIVAVTGVCKINSVVIVVNCCYSIGFSTTNSNKNTVYFANTGISVAVVTTRNNNSNEQYLLLVSLLAVRPGVLIVSFVLFSLSSSSSSLFFCGC